MASSKNDYKEIKERSLEVCRDFIRNRCSRSDFDCRFAHPPAHVEIHDGRVIVCFDYTKNRCKRSNPPCKYFHPSDHLLNDGMISKRNDDYYDRQHAGGFGSVDSYYSGNYELAPYMANALENYKVTYNAVIPWMDCQQGSSLHLGGSGKSSLDSRSDKIEVCREYKRGKCDREQCRFAHPPDSIQVGYDNFVTFCMDYINGRCSRESCRYFHPPLHLMDRLNRGGLSQGSGKKRPYKSSDGPVAAAAAAAADGSPDDFIGEEYGTASKKAVLDYNYNYGRST